MNKPSPRDDDWEEQNEKVAAASESYRQYMEADNRPKRHKKRKRWPIVLAVVLVLIAVAAAAYFLVLKKDTAKPTAKGTNTNTTAGNKATDSLASAATKQYSANNFTLTFNYPENWEVSEPSGSNKLTVTSPVAYLKAASGKNVNAKVVMTIRAKGGPLTEFSKGNATAVRDSEMLHYIKPTPSQRAASYLSFLVYSTSEGGLDAMYITGDYGYKVGQAVPAADLAPADPLISVSFLQCSDQACSHSSPVTVSSDTWNSPDIAKPIRDMLQSLAIQ